MNDFNELYQKRKENPKTINGKILWIIEKSAHNFKCFILRNKTCIDILFILVYLIEQAVFLYLIIEGISVKTISTIFILILLTTMAIERALMELRYTSLNKEISILTNQNIEFRNKIIRTKKVIEETINKIESDNILFRDKITKTKKGIEKGIKSIKQL